MPRRRTENQSTPLNDCLEESLEFTEDVMAAASGPASLIFDSLDAKANEEPEIDLQAMFGRKKKRAPVTKNLESIKSDSALEACTNATALACSHGGHHLIETDTRIAVCEPSQSQKHLSCVRVLILDDDGCNSGCVRASFRKLRREKTFLVSMVSAAELVDGILDKDTSCQSTVLLIPGGEAVAQRNRLKEAAPVVRRWLCQGGPGGIIGVCAGAVVCSGDAKRGLGFVPRVQLVNDNAWANAGLAGSVELDWCAANPLADAKVLSSMSYENGPLLKLSQVSGKDIHRRRRRHNGQEDDLDGTTEIWATYASDIAADQTAEDASALEAAAVAGDTRWACVACATWQKLSIRKCSECGASRKEAEKTCRNRSILAGQMLGRAAITATTLHNENVEVEARSAARVLLFGPHPEFGDSKECLVRAVLWVSGTL